MGGCNNCKYRFITIIIAFALHQIAIASVIYGVLRLPRIRRRSCAYILSMLFQLVRASISSLPSSYSYPQEIIFVYRIVTVQFTQTSLTAIGPKTLTSKGAKAFFYLIQSANELYVLAFLLLSPMRRLYGVGKWKDRSDDRPLNNQPERDQDPLVSATQLTPVKSNYVQLS